MFFVERRKTKKRVVSGHNEEICQLKDAITKMESELDVVIKGGESTVSRTKVGEKSYSPWVRESSYQLQNLRVSQKHTSETITCIQAASGIGAIL